MRTKTSIEWTDRTWNPIRGCSMVSAGCEHCYAMKQARRFDYQGGPYAGLTKLSRDGPRWNGRVRLVEEALRLPLTWRTPSKVFVNSMSDLFHDDVPTAFILRVWDIMASATADCGRKHRHDLECWCGPPHTFQVLTKRPARMLAVVSGLLQQDIEQLSQESALAQSMQCGTWPLPNVWLGVSVENQQTANERIPLLLQTPAVVRFVSVEPILGPVDLSVYVCPDGASGYHRGLDWVIVGGESGPQARPCDVEWIGAIVQQCRLAGVPCFVKQDAGRVPGRQRRIPDEWWVKEYPQLK